MNAKHENGKVLLIGLWAAAIAAYVGCSSAIAQSPPENVKAAESSNVEELGFEAGEPGGVIRPWFVPTPGWKAEISEEQADSGKRSAKLSLPGKSEAPFGNLMRHFDGKPYRERHVTLSARIKVVGEGRGQMWLRVDCEGGKMGAFDNMDDRPITAGEWTDAVIEADIEDDARALNIGFMSIGGGATVYIDSVKLKKGQARAALPPQSPSPPKPLSARELDNLIAASRLLSYVRFFHPSDQAAGVKAWDHFAVELIDRTEPAADAAELAKRLSEAMAPIAPTLQVWAGTPEQAPPAPAIKETKEVAQWNHHGAYRGTVERIQASHAVDSAEHDQSFVVKSLGGGVSCRIPIRVYHDGEGTLPHGSTPDEFTTTAGKLKLTALNRSTRLAGIALAWGVFQHFYPYFDVIQTDWDAVLPDALKRAAADPDELAYLATLREMLGHLHDGHADAVNMSLLAKSFLPVSLEWAGDDLVVVGVHEAAADRVKVGDVVVSIDGRTSADCYGEVSKSISAATEGWRRYRSTRKLVVNLPTQDPAAVVLRRPNGETYSVELIRVKEFTENSATSKRPENGAEIAPGVIYFNLDQAETPALHKIMPKLEQARGIVFDLRGYPDDAANDLMSHLIDEPATSARWNIPIVTRPDREGWTWSESGRWNIQPQSPRLKARIAFLTDGRAISYAESIMGIVENYKFGEIVGSATAGTNGNVNSITLPGGYRIPWTAMKVLKHDGSQHHGVGILPTVPVTPTAKGIAEGRDEVLERAVTLLGQ